MHRISQTVESVTCFLCVCTDGTKYWNCNNNNNSLIIKLVPQGKASETKAHGTNLNTALRFFFVFFFPNVDQALLVSDQFVVTFDGHLYELPSSCPLVLAQDTSAEPSFTVLLSSGSPELLLVEMNNSTFNILQNGQVCALMSETDCSQVLLYLVHSCTFDSGCVSGEGPVQQIRSAHVLL